MVDGLVAIIPGVDLLVLWVIVHARVAGVGLWEVHHRQFLRPDGVVDIKEALDGGTSSRVCVVDDIQDAADYEGTFSIVALAGRIPCVLH